MKIVCDENILFAKEFFAKLPSGTDTKLVLKAGRDICHVDLVDADCLLVRSVTKVNAALLANTSVKFVGTATIGTDHIDQEYIQEQGITFADAAGCSKKTVAQYVLSAIRHTRKQYYKDTVFTIGIVGMGNIGAVLAEYATRLGWQVLGCDPFKPSEICLENGQIVKNLTLKELARQVDVLSLHVPLTQAHESKHPTHHLLNADILNEMRDDALLINTARGAVVRETDLLESLENGTVTAVLDVFEHEPTVSKLLLDNLAIATPHIAGYSVEGKARGTQFVYNAWCAWQGVLPHDSFQNHLAHNPYQLTENTHTATPNIFRQQLGQYIPIWYDISKDDTALRACSQVSNQANGQAQCFDTLRKNYQLRREWLI